MTTLNGKSGHIIYIDEYPHAVSAEEITKQTVQMVKAVETATNKKVAIVGYVARTIEDAEKLARALRSMGTTTDEAAVALREFGREARRVHLDNPAFPDKREKRRKRMSRSERQNLYGK